MNCINVGKLHLNNYVRLLWEQHATWTGMAITSIVFKLPNEDPVINRLLRNPRDFAAFLSNFYGEEKGKEFGELLTSHLVLAAELLKAIMAKDEKKAKEIRTEWYKNGEEIAIFLSQINPYWSREVWQEMFFEHLGFVEDIGVNLINGNYEEAIETQDLLELGVLEMADVMIEGILKQFPCQF